MELREISESRVGFLSVLNREWFQITLLTLVSISAPLFLKSPQLLVGSIVNFVLFFSAKRFGFKKSLPSILLPSLIAYSSNILFKGATHFLIFFVPIIFLGNTVYVLLSRYIKKDIFSVIFSSICKALLLYIFAFVFVKELGLPQIFLKSMGIMQFFTALIGGSLALVLTKDIVLES
jgi:hypothetical protein